MASMRSNTSVAVVSGAGPVSVIRRGRKKSTGGRGGAPPASPVNSAHIGLVMFLVAETMFFSGLIGAYLVFRFSHAVWPPPDLPSLPIAVTWVNTVILSVSGLTALGAVRAVHRDDQIGLRRGLAVTAILGGVFVGVQGSEWLRLVHHGLTLASGTFGASFYTLIGAHAAHVLAAIFWLIVIAFGAWRGRFTARRCVAVELCTAYWGYVCIVWLFLFVLVYQ